MNDASPQAFQVMSTSDRMPKGCIGTRALIDSNIWRYVVDSNEQGSFLDLARSPGVHIQVAPAVVYEALRLQDIPLRNRIIGLMSNRRMVRLMPEAYSESMEILGEIREKRPEWIRRAPDLVFFERLRKDWAKRTGGFWVRVAEEPDREAHRLSRMEVEMVEGSRRQVKEARKEMIAVGWKRNPPMDKTVGEFHEPTPGWSGEPVDAWKFDSFYGLTSGLSQTANAYRDWIAPFVELDTGLLSSPSWTKFWLHDVEVGKVPRQWMRWAHSFAQRFRTVTSGSPGDTQLFTYFLDTDIVVTGDKALLSILEECRPYSPFPLPKSLLVRGGKEGLEEMFDELHRLSRPPPPSSRAERVRQESDASPAV